MSFSLSTFSIVWQFESDAIFVPQLPGCQLSLLPVLGGLPFHDHTKNLLPVQICSQVVAGALLGCMIGIAGQIIIAVTSVV